MKVFITGVAGFLGSNLANKLIEKGYEVVGVDNLCGGFIENVNPYIEFYNEDCNNYNKILEYSKDCDIFFHAACVAPDGYSYYIPSFSTENTLNNTLSVLRAAITNNAEKFIYCSSMARYGDIDTIPYTEEMQCNPISPYAIAKLASEKNIKALCELNNLYYTILVPHNIYGPNQNYTDPYRNVAAIMINRMLRGEQPIIFGDGEQKRCFSYVDDCLSCIMKVIEQDNLNGEVINIGPDEEFVTINELAKMIAEILDFDLEPIRELDRPKEVKYAICSSDKARRLLGYQTNTTLYEGLKKLAEYIKERGPKEFDYAVYKDIELPKKAPEAWTKQKI